MEEGQEFEERIVKAVEERMEAVLERLLPVVEAAQKKQVIPPELSSRDAARYIGVDVGTLKKIRKLGLVRYRDASLPGSGKPRFRYPVEDLDRLMQQGYRRDLPRPAKVPARRQKAVPPQTYEHLDL